MGDLYLVPDNEIIPSSPSNEEDEDDNPPDDSPSQLNLELTWGR